MNKRQKKYSISLLKMRPNLLHYLELKWKQIKKNNTAAGEDFIVAELLENSGQSLLEAFHIIIVSI
jgi:hypothetical protein